MNKTWTIIPTWWISRQESNQLRGFQNTTLGDSISALILYILLCLRANEKRIDDIPPGNVCITFSDIETLTSLSRHLISRGMRKLESLGVIRIQKEGRKNVYTIEGYGDKPMEWGKRSSWGKLPIQRLYDTQGRLIFSRFSLRYPAELYSLKLYLLFIAFQQSVLPYAMISYPKISEHSGIPINNIRSGLSHLVNLSLIHIDRDSSPRNDKNNNPNMYRICGVSPKRHLGTIKPEVVTNYFADDI